jgi:hypothetical protein
MLLIFRKELSNGISYHQLQQSLLWTSERLYPRRTNTSACYCLLGAVCMYQLGRKCLTLRITITCGPFGWLFYPVRPRKLPQNVPQRRLCPPVGPHGVKNNNTSSYTALNNWENVSSKGSEKKQICLEFVISGDVDKIYALLGYYAGSSGDPLPTFRNRSHLQGSKIPRRPWPLKMGPTRCPETSVKDHHSALRNIPEERRSRDLS